MEHHASVPRGHLLIVSVQARILHGRKQWERHKTRYGIFGAILEELRIVSLARLRPCTESWLDFTYIRADYAGATSALSSGNTRELALALDLVRYGANSVTASSRPVSLDGARQPHLPQRVVALP